MSSEMNQYEVELKYEKHSFCLLVSIISYSRKSFVVIHTGPLLSPRLELSRKDCRKMGSQFGGTGGVTGRLRWNMNLVQRVGAGELPVGSDHHGDFCQGVTPPMAVKEPNTTIFLHFCHPPPFTICPIC